MGVEGGWNSNLAVKLCCVSHHALSCHLNSKRVWQLDLTRVSGYLVISVML